MFEKGRGGLLVVGLAGLIAMPLALVMLLGLLVSDDEDREQAAAEVVGSVLDASKVPAEFMPWLIKGGTVCPELTAPMLAAQIETESGFKDHPPNQAGAAGPAQWIPASWAAYGVDADGDGTKDLHSVADAVMATAILQCAEWKRWAAAFPGQDTWALVLAGYNAGPGAVQQYAGVPPYPETLTYIARIKQRTAWFQSVISGTVGAYGGGWVPPAPGGPDTAFGAVGSWWSWTGYHTGTDWPVPTGTPVVSMGPGVVAEVNHPGGSSHGAAWGNQVVVYHGLMATDHGQRHVWTTYNHLSATTVTVGQQVAAGQQVGLSGATGNVSGPHLHAEVHLSTLPTWSWSAPQRTDFADPVAFITAHAGPTTAGGHAGIAAWALQQIGKPYIWGGSGPDGYDCSGLVTQAVTHSLGVTLPRTTQQEVTSPTLATISRDQLQKGDLIFFQLHGDWDHVGIYLGDGRMVHAPRPGKTVEVVDVTAGYYANHPTTYRRVKGA